MKLNFLPNLLPTFLFNILANFLSKYGFCALALLFNTTIVAQKKPTYFTDIQPIIQKNCITCHRLGQVAPFPLTSFEDVVKRASFIAQVTRKGYMPPYKADPLVGHFKNLKKLTEAEIQTLETWAKTGKKKGKEKKDKSQKMVDSSQTIIREPDLVLSFQKPFLVKGDNKEQFRIFVIPTNTTEDMFVEGIDFLPENRSVAHHCRIMIDTSNLLRSDDGIEVGASSEFEKRSVAMNNNFWHGWIPGNTAIFFPEGTAKVLPKNADLVLNMHFSPSPADLSERGRVLIYLAKKKPQKLIKTFILDENWVSNQPFFIPKDTVIKFYMRSPLLPTDLSLVSITPHMHVLGKNFKAYAITPDGDLVQLIKIDEWDFEWQMTYQFASEVKLPKGSVIYAEADYDNTAANPLNPFQPPQNVPYGWGTKQEMLNLIFQYID
jgi:hypothetical protein